MNKTIKIIKGTLGLSIFLLVFIIIPSVVGGLETRYNRYGTVIEVNTEETLIEDKTGNIWAIYTEEKTNFKVGDEVKMRMYNNYTDNKINDDEILKVKKLQ